MEIDSPIVALAKGDNRVKNIYKVLELVLNNSSDKIEGPVVLKPNFLSVRNKNASSYPDTISAVLSFLRERYAGSIYIVEGSHVAASAFKTFGLFEIAKRYGAKCFCIDTDEKEWVEADMISLGGLYFKARVSKLVSEAGSRISLAVPKTHANIGVTLSLKNMVGSVHPSDRKLVHGLAADTPKELLHAYRRRLCDQDNFFGMISARIEGIIKRHSIYVHKCTNRSLNKKGAIVINKNIAGLSKLVAPHLSIIDGFIGMEGEGPWHGMPVFMHTALASKNFAAVDTIACRMMGFEDELLGYKDYLDIQGTEIEAIKIIGENFQNCRYSLQAHSNFYLL